MKALITPLHQTEEYIKLKQLLNNNTTPVAVSGTTDSQKSHLSGAIISEIGGVSVYITPSELKAREVFEDMQFFLKDRVYLYPAKDIIFYSADLKSAEIDKRRFCVLEALIKGENPVIVMSVEALFDRLVKKEIFEQYILQFEPGDEISILSFTEMLVFMGYERRTLVESAGQFAVRGGIVDLFTSTGDNAYRIEFWGDEIDSIRILDALSQRSVEKVDNIKLFPMRGLVYGEDELAHAIEAIGQEQDSILEKLADGDLSAESEVLRGTINEVLEKLREFKSFTGVDRFIQYFYDETVCILDYLPQESIIFFDEPARIREQSTAILQEYDESIKGRIVKGYMLPKQMDMIFSYDQILEKSRSYKTVLYTALDYSINDFSVYEKCKFSVKGQNRFGQKIDLLFDELKKYLQRSYRVVVLAGVRSRAERLVTELMERNMSAVYSEELDADIEKGIITITKGSLCNGFEYEDLKLAIITDKDLFGQLKQQKKHKKKKNAARIETFTDLRIGDYIVHDNHGVGIYKGIEKMIVDGISKDYIKLGYSDGGNLYVATSQMDMIQKYIGGESNAPKLNKLGGADWGKAKAKARKAVKVIAGELMELYSKRREAVGYTFSKDTVWQSEFEEKFQFQETEDQLTAIEDVKADMESSKVMDRLICGDVGYGKTEVAIRGAFKAVQDGKQVAYLVPTTILAQQHYHTFRNRMRDYPINVSMLSRFCTPKQQREIMKGLESGTMDIVIGTHKILSDDMKFKDLGLLIVDEEQRFGVTHKEKLKRFKENVDVLTLTATPIPRTLHMSLSGIRDMSVLEEPPKERQPIQTYVMEHNPELIRSAIHRELARGGQVYYLYNRVRSIVETAKRIQDLVPEANVAYAHGQMTERELENIMMDFIDGDINVMVCTTIIETGLDIPNVNTIIIHDADKMGLSQLYQLRGRVGRSNRMAYAYLMYKKDKVLQEVAEKRLQTIRDFTEFGSGFKIAMRDLEIRGAGNILGGEQHGHMDMIGYDMYCKLLDEAVRELSGSVSQEGFETSVDINVNAFIPPHYIENEEQKLEVYKKISVIKSDEDYRDIQEEIEDRFGDLPQSVQNLLDIALLKEYAHRLGIVSVAQKQRRIIFMFKSDSQVDVQRLIEILNNNKGKLELAMAGNPHLIYNIDKKNTGTEFLSELVALVKLIC